MLTSLLLALAEKPGLKVGDFVSPFEPMHVTGPYAGVRQCPVCEWMMLPMVFIWSNQASAEELKPWVAAAQEEVGKIGPSKVKAFFVDANAAGQDRARLDWVKKAFGEFKTPDVYAMVRLKSMPKSVADYKLKPFADWKVQVYTAKNRRVESIWINPKTGDLDAFRAAIQKLGK